MCQNFKADSFSFVASLLCFDTYGDRIVSERLDLQSRLPNVICIIVNYHNKGYSTIYFKNKKVHIIFFYN